MSSAERSVTAFEDFKVHVRIKIAALWTAAMFCYVYGDIFVLQQPGHLDLLISGKLWQGGLLTQGMLLSFAISMAIPSVMIFLSLVLRPNICRWVNIVLGLFTTIFMLLTLTSKDVWYFYMFLGTVETVLTLSIVLYAWKWPRQGAA